MTASPRAAQDVGLHRLPAGELLRAYADRDLSPIELVEALIARIEELDPRLNAVWTPTFTSAREEAVGAERAYRDRMARPLEGVPFVVKDVFDTAGVLTTYGSAMFRDHRPARDAAVVRRLRAAGAILLGKTALHEFACGGTGLHPHFGTTRNPWDTDRIAGGSSGGSAVALAAGFAPLGLGTDTAGSVRMPSALCGAAGLKPSYGRISVEGVFANVPSLDHVGPMARTAADLELMLGVLDGEGAGSGTGPSSADVVQDARVGIVTPWEGAAVTEPARDAVSQAATTLARLGATLHQVEIPELGFALDTLRTIQAFEFPYMHATAGIYPRRRAEYGADVLARLDGGLEGVGGRTVQDYVAAGTARHRLRAAFSRAFADADVLLMPAVGLTAPEISAVHDRSAAEAVTRDLLSHTVGQSLAGLPACSVPGAWHDGLPLGVQLTAPYGDDHNLLHIAMALDTGGEVAEPGER